MAKKKTFTCKYSLIYKVPSIIFNHHNHPDHRNDNDNDNPDYHNDNDNHHNYQFLVTTKRFLINRNLISIIGCRLQVHRGQEKEQCNLVDADTNADDADANVDDNDDADVDAVKKLK